jgi:hypothetical protein
MHAYLVEKGAQHFSETGWNNSTALEISTPATIGDLSASTTVAVQFQNTGTEEISNVTLKAFLNGQLEVEDELSLTSPLQPGESMSHTFSASLDMSSTDMDLDLSILIFSENDEAANDNVLNSHFDLVTGLNDRDDLSFQVYPNPSSGEIVLFASGISGVGTVRILDIQGRILVNQTFLPNALSQGQRLLLDLKSGTYLIEVSSNGFLTSQRISIEE